MFLIEIIAKALPFVVALFDSGYYTMFNPIQLKDYVEAWTMESAMKGQR